MLAILAAAGCGSTSYWLGGGADGAGIAPDAGAIDSAAPAREAAGGASGEGGATSGEDAGQGDACTPATVATGGKSPTFLAVDDDGVFWSETGHLGTGADPNVIVQAPKGGATRTTVIALSGVPGAIALDPGYVYYVENGSPSPSGYTVLREGKPGKPPSTRGDYAQMASPAAPPGSIAISGTRLLWVDAVGLYETTVDAVQGAFSTVVSAPNGALGLALAGTTAWVSDTSANAFSIDFVAPVIRTGISGSTPSFGIAADGTRIFWTTQSEVFSRTVADGPVTSIASCATTCDAVATDGTTVYWATTHEVWAAPTAGGTPRSVGTGYVDVHHLAMDATRVYWTDTSTGSVWSTCK
jgi:hypothetical protein